LAWLRNAIDADAALQAVLGLLRNGIASRLQRFVSKPGRKMRHRLTIFYEESICFPRSSLLCSAANHGRRSQPDAAAPSPTPTHPPGYEAAVADTKKLQPGTGLEATLFAFEPMVVNPCDMDIDARGRVWITEGANYRISMHKDWGIIRPGGDRIVILEDTNGDGRADKDIVFYQDDTVNAALGICVLGNKAIVSSSPHVFVLTDTDGDSVADKRELLFQDTSRGDHDHCVHAFVFRTGRQALFQLRKRNQRTAPAQRRLDGTAAARSSARARIRSRRGRRRQ
jgi:hypothetical protein